MITDIEITTVTVPANEIVFIACDTEQTYNWQFQDDQLPCLNISHSEIPTDVLEFYPPELGHLSIYDYVSQKLATLPFDKPSLAEWMDVFQLRDHQSKLLSEIDSALSIKLRLLLSVVDQSELILIPSHIDCVDYVGNWISDIRDFCEELVKPWPHIKTRFVIYGKDIDSHWAFSVDKILEIELDGTMREWGIDLY